MKKIIYSLLLVGSMLNIKSQNTIPTTTVAGALSVSDSLHVVKSISTLGAMTVKGEVLAKDTLTAMENILAQKDVKVDGSVYVNQDIIVEGKLTAKGGLTFDGVNGLFRTPATATTGEIIKLGDITPTPQSSFYCPTPDTELWNQFYYNGNFVSYLPAGGSPRYPLINAAVRIGIAPWNGNGMIDISGVDSRGAGNNGLEINTFCKRNTAINMGWDLSKNPEVNGGRVNMGAEVEMVRSLKIGWNGTPSIIDPKTAIEINQNTPNTSGVKVKTWETSIKAFAVEYTNGATGFEVLGSGATKVQNLKISDFVGIGNRNVQVDATGKLITAIAGTQGTGWNLGGNVGAGMSFGTTDNSDLPLITNNQTQVTIAKNGNVYFGTKKIQVNHVHANSPYQFDGKIACKELVVVDPTKWSDFVFDKTYKLLPLNEVETFYLKNKHLPSVPSETEVKENGINTTEMDALLLQKIEELTLYIVQQQKDIEELKKQIKK